MATRASKRRSPPSSMRTALRAPALYLRERGGAGPQAGRDRARRSGQGALHHRRLGRQRGGAQDRPGRDRPLQDDLLLGRLPRRRLRGRRRWRRGAVPLGPDRAVARRHRACRALHLLPLSLRLPGPGRPAPARALRDDLRQLRALRLGEGGRRRRGDRRAGARRAQLRAAWFLAVRAPGLRRPRRALDLRRDPHRPGQDRTPLRLRARGRRARHSGARQVPGRRPCCRSPPSSPGPSWTSPAIGPSATTPTRRTR